MALVLTDEAKKFLIKKGSNLDFGARPLRRALENFVEDPLSEELLKGEFQGKDTITVDVKEVAGQQAAVLRGRRGRRRRAAARSRRSRPRRLQRRPGRGVVVAVSAGGHSRGLGATPTLRGIPRLKPTASPGPRVATRWG